MGGGILLRATNSTFTPPSSAESFAFSSLAQFAADEPSRVTFPAARDAAMAGRYAAAQTERQYRYSQEFLFVEDSVRVGERFLLHVGVRYDSLGAPLNTGAEKDWRIQLNSGASLPQKLTGATLPSPGFGSQQLYNRDGNDWAPRAGFAWNLRREGGTILRGSYGIFYDQPFDNLWQNLRFNNSVPATAVLSARPLDYLHTPLSTMLSGVAVTGSLQLLPLTLYQPGIRTPYVQSFFMELEQRISANMLLRAAYAGSIGRKLLTTDLVNRVGSTHPYFACPASDGSCRYSEILDNDVDYRANQGTSEYHAAIVSMDYRSRWGELHASYTLSHSIDNQSDPLLGGLSASLEVTNLTPGLVTPRPSEFTEQFNSSIDRASSDFDQRHSFVFYSVWKLPAIKRRGWLSFLTRDWSVSQLGAVRSGLPYTIYASGSLNTISASGAPGVLKYNRADVVPSVPLGLNTGPYADGQRLVNPNSFADPLNQLGNLGRNALKGPGLFNVDLSISRSWPLHLLGESARLSIRADAYNAFNHANLNNPSPDRVAVGAHNFAVAQYGRVEGMSQLFAAGPLNESARRIQMMLRISF
jgi:hypothetical protein